jgi:hypothetical protein
MLERFTNIARRVTGLHGDALGNAATSMRANRRAREHREAIEHEVREAVSVDVGVPAGVGAGSDRSAG